MTKSDPVRPDRDAGRGVDLTARLEEQLLVERVRAGDPLAFEAIFRRYYGELCRVAEHVVGSAAGAEDVVQDVFLRVWALRARWDVTVSVQAYLRRAVRNMALRHATRASARGHESLPVLVDSRPSPEEQAEAAAMAEEIAGVTATLPPRPRQVYELSRGQGLTTRQIAERLGISSKTVEAHLTHALAALRSAVARWRGEQT